MSSLRVGGLSASRGGREAPETDGAWAGPAEERLGNDAALEVKDSLLKLPTSNSA